MRRRVPLAVLGALLLAAPARAATPRLVASGSGGYAFAGGRDIVQALVPPRGSHRATVRLLRGNGSLTRVGTRVLPPGAVTGVAVDASSAGALVFSGVSNDLGVDAAVSAGPLTGPLTPLDALAPDSFTSGWLLAGSSVLALRQRPGATAAAPQSSLVAFDLGGRLIAEQPLAAPPGQQAFEVRAAGPTRAVLFENIDAKCRPEARVLDTGRPAIPVHGDRPGAYCKPEWSDWQVQADGKIAAVDVRPASGRARLSWFGTDGRRHRVPGLVDPGVPGLGFAGDRLLFARWRSRGRSDLVVRTLGGRERVLAHLDAAAAAGTLSDFDGTRALWTTARCAAPMRAYLAANVMTTTAAPAAKPVVCGVTDAAHEAEVSSAGRVTTAFDCRASSSLRCVGEVRLALRGRLFDVLPLSIPGGTRAQVAFRLDPRARAALRAAAPGSLAVREDIRWRDERGVRRTGRGTLYLDAP